MEFEMIKSSESVATSTTELPAVGAWVITLKGRQGQVAEHLCNRPAGRPDVARIRFAEGKYGTYQAGELKDIGE